MCDTEKTPPCWSGANVCRFTEEKGAIRLSAHCLYSNLLCGFLVAVLSTSGNTDKFFKNNNMANAYHHTIYLEGEKREVFPLIFWMRRSVLNIKQCWWRFYCLLPEVLLWIWFSSWPGFCLFLGTVADIWAWIRANCSWSFSKLMPWAAWLHTLSWLDLCGLTSCLSKCLTASKTSPETFSKPYPFAAARV